MPAPIVIDSGPLIALFDRDDRYHDEAVAFVRRLRRPLVANLAVVTEVAYLLDFHPRVRIDFLGWVRDGGLTLIDSEAADFDRIIQLMEKYADLPIDFTDAAIIALCEKLEVRDVASVDGDFRVYRYRNRLTFRNHFFRK